MTPSETQTAETVSETNAPTPSVPPEASPVVNHLLFHKSLLSEADGSTRLNEYLSMVREGEHLSMKDPFDRSIALLFELVVQNRLNPWDIDLVRFSALYLEHARERNLDLVTAGRIILLAWTVLKLQSDDLVRRVEARKEEAEHLSWEEIPDWGLSGEELDFTERLRHLPRAPLDEKVWHEGDRKVTLMELVDAFEHAREESETRRVLNDQREALRTRLKIEGQDRFKNRVHKEDLEEDLQLVWNRILQHNGVRIPLKSLCNVQDVWDFVTAFNSVLFLHRDRKIELTQDQFPYGSIHVQNLSKESTEPIPVLTSTREATP